MDYRPRVEQDFARIEQWTRTGDGEVHWQVTDRQGAIYVFGKDPHARISDPHDRTRILVWLLESSADQKGNRIVYSYKAENGENVPDTICEIGRDKHAQKYLSMIRYGQSADSANDDVWNFEMVFDYGEREFGELSNLKYGVVEPWPVRQDPFSTYRPGFEIRTYRLCHAGLMYHRFPRLNQGAPQLVNAMRFRYQQTPRMSFLQVVESIGFRVDVPC